MKEQMIFKRTEIKYMLTREQYESLKSEMNRYMKADEHGRNTILSLYYDTPDYLLIRRSMEHPLYKEKIRLRSYGVAGDDTKVFMELKKKYDHVVYKRRLGMKQYEMDRLCEDFENQRCEKNMESDFDCGMSNTDKAGRGNLADSKSGESDKPVNRRRSFVDTQITKEIAYCFKRYEDLRPAVLLSYDREAFYAVDNHDFRITFDQNILWRDYDLDLRSGVYGTPILKEDQVLMEVKTAGGMPLWLTHFLTYNRIFKTSFSKYANAYRALCF